MIFEGESLGGTHRSWGDPSLNSTTILFDKTISSHHSFANITSMSINCGLWRTENIEIVHEESINILLSDFIKLIEVV